MKIQQQEEPPPGRSRLFEWLANFFLRDRREFLEFFNSQARRGFLDDFLHTLVNDVLRLHDLRVRDVMVSRSRMKVVSLSASYDEILETVVENGHTRFPVIADDLDDIEGVLLVKNLLAARATDSVNGGFDIRDHICPPFVVPESRRLSRLLDGFKRAHTHLAIVVNEYGGTCGLVTSNDIFGQVFEDFVDREVAQAPAGIRKLDEHLFLVDGLLSLDDFNHYFALPDDGERVETVGGMVVGRLESLPKGGERLELGGLDIEVKSADGRRALQLVVRKAEK